MEELVYRPVQLAFANRSTEGNSTVTIVVDGLDDCQDREEVEEFIEHLLSYFSSNQPLPLKFVISSRIEEHLQALLSAPSVRIENLCDHIPHADIRTFLTTSFTRAAQHSRVIYSYTSEHQSQPWPSQLELERLLDRISGSFIFASTLLQYILSPSTLDGLTPMERLPRALSPNPGLDSLYSSTLARCASFPHFP
jgi:hypothetical protein